MTLNVTGQVYDSIDGTTIGGKKSSISQASDKKVGGRLTVQTSEVDINESATVTSPGHCVLKNIGTTDRIDYGWATTAYLCSLEPGESATFRIISTGSARIFAKAEGANDSDNLQYSFYAL